MWAALADRTNLVAWDEIQCASATGTEGAQHIVQPLRDPGKDICPCLERLKNLPRAAWAQVRGSRKPDRFVRGALPGTDPATSIPQPT